MEIRAAVTNSKEAPFGIETIELGELAPDEVLVEVAAAGICHTDLIVRDQWYPVPLPAVLGHEGAGTITAVGAAVSKVVPGDRVGMSFGSCGVCPNCRSGKPTYCHQFMAHNFAASRLDGSTALSRQGEPIHSHFFSQSSFATHAVATERNVVKLPDDLPFPLAAPLGCGIQTGAGAVLNSFAVPPGASIAVYGTGTVGLSAVMAAKVAGAGTIIAIDTRAERTQLAQQLGATHAIEATGTDVVQEVRKITGTGTDFALDTTGVPEVLRNAVDASGPRGQTGIVGAPPMGTEVSLDVNGLLTSGLAVRGIVEGDSVPAVFIPLLIELWRQGKFPVEKLITTYDFDQIETAVEDVEAGKTVKAVLTL